MFSCQFVQRIRLLVEEEIKEEQTGRCLLLVLQSVQSVESLCFLTESARTVEHTTSVRSLQLNSGLIKRKNVPTPIVRLCNWWSAFFSEYLLIFASLSYIMNLSRQYRI